MKKPGKAAPEFDDREQATIEKLIAILIPFFEQELHSDFAIHRRHDLRHEFNLSEEQWLAFEPIINSYPSIRAMGLTISREQMKVANTVTGIATRLATGRGEKHPRVLKGRPSTVAPKDVSIDLKAIPERGRGSNFTPHRAARPALDAISDASSGFQVDSPEEDDRSAGASGASSKPDAQQPSLHFVLEGAARGGEALWGEEFDLLFRYGLVTADALANIKQTKVDVTGEVALGVEVIPKGLALAKGGAFRLVRFKDGAIVEDPPRFRLKAPKKEDAEPAPAGVYVTFTVHGAVVYSFFLGIERVEKLSEISRPAPTIDLDLEEVMANETVEPRNAWITIRKKGGPWEIYGGIYGSDDDLLPDVTSILNESSLSQAYGDGILEEIKTIAGDTAWRFVDANLELPADQKEAASACMRKTMTVGYKLFRRFSEDPVFRKVIDLIESLPDGSKVTVKTDREAFPWELLYPLHYIDDDQPENFQPGLFWGNRFLFESLLLPTSEAEKLPNRRQQGGSLRVSMGLNSGIDTEPPWAGREPLPVRVQKDFFDAALKDRGGCFDQYSDILKIVRDANPASLIYFFCHGTARELKFDKTSSITADNVDGGPRYPGWPIVFINACDAGNISPLSFYSFRTEFRKRNAAGIIAPSFPVPTMFAAMFGNSFLSSYCKREQVGEALFNLRRELLAKNNPLGLWYSLQCPLDVKAPEQ